jgi:hypothetical protein
MHGRTATDGQIVNICQRAEDVALFPTGIAHDPIQWHQNPLLQPWLR